MTENNKIGVTLYKLQTTHPVIPSLVLYLRVLEHWVYRNSKQRISTPEARGIRFLGLLAGDPKETDPVCALLQRAYQAVGPTMDVPLKGAWWSAPYSSSPWFVADDVRWFLREGSPFWGVIDDTRLIVALPNPGYTHVPAFPSETFRRKGLREEDIRNTGRIIIGRLVRQVGMINYLAAWCSKEAHLCP